jgi:hypothetical protein
MRRGYRPPECGPQTAWGRHRPFVVQLFVAGSYTLSGDATGEVEQAIDHPSGGRDLVRVGGGARVTQVLVAGW